MLISVILCTLNEEKNIASSLDSIISFTLPKDTSIEIIIADGLSKDGTRKILKNFENKYKNIKIIDNEKFFQVHGLNSAIKLSQGSYILWLGAHAFYPKNYLNELIRSAVSHNTDYVGGVVNTVPYNDSYSASIVQALTTHKFGIGNSSFRSGNLIEGPADTASFGLIKKTIFNRIGYYNEKLIRCQDYEFNRRIKEKGGLVWINPKAVATYKNAKSLAFFLFKQIKLEAPYNVYMWYLARYTFAYRHGITGVFVLGLIGGSVLTNFFPLIGNIFYPVLLLYFVLAVISSIQQAIRYKTFLHIFSLPFSFLFFHIFHGLGIIIGSIKILTKSSPLQK